MAKLEWDKVAEHYYETGVRNGVLYVSDSSAENGYGKGVAWNGLTAVTESPSGADVSDLYADDIKYLALRSAEDFGATIEAYTYPDEFAECDGSKSIAPGITIGQQPRKSFAFSYRTAIGNDVDYENHGFKIHIIYGASASPSEKNYQTINDSPEAITFSWELSTVPIAVKDAKPTAHLEIDSTKCSEAALTAIMNKLYGTDDTEPTLLTPNEIAGIIAELSGATGATGATGG